MNELKVNLEKEHRLEKTMTTDFLKQIRNKGYFAYKLSDGSLGMKPFDVIISTGEASYYVELKMIDNDIFKINQLRDNQYSALKRNHALCNHNISLIIVYSKKIKKLKFIPFEVIANLSRNGRIQLDFDAR